MERPLRDRVRRFWRGDPTCSASRHRARRLLRRFAPPATRGVNFIAAHDGFPLADLAAYPTSTTRRTASTTATATARTLLEQRRRGPTDDPPYALRGRDVRALLATLFASRGTIMLTAGDEFGRNQGGNNNAYAQDNAITWLDWDARDRDLEAFTAALAAFRRAHPALVRPALPHRRPRPRRHSRRRLAHPRRPAQDACRLAGRPRRGARDGARRGGDGRLAVLFNRSEHEVAFHLPSRAEPPLARHRAGRRIVGPRSGRLRRRAPGRHPATAVTIAPPPLEARRPGP